jgi:hypothetical protein
LSPPRTRILYITPIFIGIMLGFIPFAPYAGVMLGLWWNEYTEPSDTPRRTKPLRMIHTHGSRSIDTARRDPVLPVATAPGNDAEAVDLLTDREAIYDTWRHENNTVWLEMDSAIRSCTRIRFVNGFGQSMEDVIDECLDYYESEIDDE